MSWNYRLCKQTVTTPSGELETVFAIHEVYYEEDGQITAWTERPAYPMGETRDEFLGDMYHYRQAVEKGIVDLDVAHPEIKEES